MRPACYGKTEWTQLRRRLDFQAIEKLREEELEEARSIPSVMFPAESLCAGKVSIGHAFQPMAEVGGDFLDYFELTDGSVGLYVGDVSGKGLPAAMYAPLAVGTRSTPRTKDSESSDSRTFGKRDSTVRQQTCSRKYSALWSILRAAGCCTTTWRLPSSTMDATESEAKSRVTCV